MSVLFTLDVFQEHGMTLTNGLEKWMSREAWKVQLCSSNNENNTSQILNLKMIGLI